MLHFIYEETHPVTNIPFYIGISTNPNQRHKQHLDTRDNNLRKKAVIDRLAADGLEPRMNILESVNSFEQSRARERHWIRHYANQGIMLTNIQDHDISGFVEFDGCLFRSTREAQWAIFFNTLDIPYQYREKGIIIKGEWYIPAFWLPQQDCFIEIYEDQREKAKEIVLQTNKAVYFSTREIGLSGWMDKEYPPSLWTYSLYDDPNHTKIKGLSQDAMIILQRLKDIDIELRSDGYRIYVAPYEGSVSTPGIPVSRYREIIQKQMACLPSLMPALKSVENELIVALHVPGGYPCFSEQDCSEGYRWAECSKCHDVLIVPPGDRIDECGGSLGFDSPRLIAAIAMVHQSLPDNRKHIAFSGEDEE